MGAIGVKIGSQLLTDKDGYINKGFIGDLCKQLCSLKKSGNSVFLVTSGAIASDPKRNRSDNLRAAVGQGRLIGWYRFFIEEVYGLEVAQLLPTYNDLEGEKRIFQKTLFEALAAPEVIPIINFNDPMDSKEVEALHRFADNDQLFLEICILVKADVAVIGFLEKGLLSGEGNLVRLVNLKNANDCLAGIKGGSELGHGKEGMFTKHSVLCQLANAGIYTVLAPGREEGFVQRAVSREVEFGTVYTK